MGLNEILLVLSSMFSVMLIFLAWKLDKERLHSIILIFLILISIGGGKIVEFFGYATNTGNVFYGGVFLATYFLIERHGRREGFRSIWVGIIGVLFFSILLQITLALVGQESTSQLNNSLSSALASAPRLALASILAYAISQSINVFLYSTLKERFDASPKRRLWLRANIASVAAQIVDSLVFFTIAFWGVVAPADIWEILLVGFVIKVLFVMLFSPLLYLNKVEQEEDREYSSLTLR